VGDIGAAIAAAREARPAAGLGLTADCRGDPVSAARRAALADAAAGSVPANNHGATLFLPLERGGPRGFDAGKKIKGRKRHILTDTQGLLVGAIVHTADIQDRDGAPDVLASIRHSFPWLRHLFADGGYAGDKLRSALTKIGTWSLEIIKRSDTAKGFKLLAIVSLALRR